VNPMAELRILFTQTRFAMLTALRTARVVAFGIAFPVLLLVLFNSIFAQGHNKVTHLGALRIDTQAYYTAGMAAYAIMLQTFTSLSISLTTQRESGQLKRLRGTPMPRWTFMTAFLLRSVVFVAAMLVVLFAIGALAFHVKLHGAPLGGMAIYAALGTASLAALGVAVTIVCSTPEAAATIGPFSAVLLSFVSGVFIPVADLPHWLQVVGKVFPLSHLATGLQRGVAIGHPGLSLKGSDLAIMAGWMLAGVLIASIGFRWEPQGRGQ
jgi:ABC-2 type transport system permease protein